LGDVRRIFAVLTLSLLLVTPVVVSASPDDSSSVEGETGYANGAYCADAEEWALLQQINDYRFDEGLDPLTLSETLGGAADHHSESMAAFNYFDASHDLHFEGPAQDSTVSWQDNIANFGYPDNTHTSRAENLAAGYELGEETLAQWKSSPSHNEHLLSEKFQAIGIGRAFNPDSEYRWYWTVTFGSYVDSVATSCDDSTSEDGAPATGDELNIERSGRNGSSTDSSVAYDGDEATTWYTTKARTPNTGYIWFDLGEVQTISQIEYLFSNEGGADAFQIQVSNDKEEWSTIAELGNPKIGKWQSFVWVGDARYVRFFFTNPNGAEKLGFLAEVRLYA